MRLLVSTASFGLGSAGKAASVLAELPEAEVVVYGSELGASVFERSTRVVGRVASGAPIAAALERFAPDVALVVLDPTVANDLVALGCPVAYVDSLPFLWSSADEVPGAVDVYLAQQTPVLPDTCWGPLRSVQRLRWTGAIVPRTSDAGMAAGADVVVNLGGLVSWFRGADEISYPHVVLPAVLDALAAAGHRSVLVATSADAVAAVSSAASDARLDVDVRNLSHADFAATIRQASLLVTSPGLTTLLESGRCQVPTVVLPPQNLSQCFNVGAVAHAGGSASCVPWPQDVLDLAQVEAQRRDGEEAAVTYIYGAIDRALGDHATRRSLTDALGAALEAPVCAGAGLVDLVGDDGAVAVADAIRSCSRRRQAPEPVPV